MGEEEDIYEVCRKSGMIGEDGGWGEVLRLRGAEVKEKCST